MRSKSLFFCRVCGLKQRTPPWGEDGQTSSFEICNCCGVEFGYEDCRLDAIRKFRDAWVKKGAPWFNPKAKRKSWSLEKQLSQILKEYL